MGAAAIAQIPEYQELFAKAFPAASPLGATVEDTIRSGKAIATYERTVLANEAPFQKGLKGDKAAMSDRGLRGAIVFFSSSCVQCHAGPNLGKNEFDAVGFADHPNDFSGLNLGLGSVIRRAEDDFKFKVPQLYNLTDNAPYVHDGSFESLRDVVLYFNRGEAQSLAAKYSGNLSRNFVPLDLSEAEIEDLTGFLETGLRDPHLTRYLPKRLPSGLCFPNNDVESRQQINCN